MIKKGSYTVKITDMNDMGYGIAKIDGAVVFIPSLVTGDEAEIEVTEIKKNFAIGRSLSIISPSEKRITPICHNEEQCGGCVFGHISYEYENELKEQIVRGALIRNGLSDVKPEKTVFPAEREKYRNKLGVHYSPRLRSFCMYREKSRDAVLFESCLLASDEMNEVIKTVNKNISALLPTDPCELFVRSSDTGELTVSLYAKKPQNDKGNLLKLLKSKHPSVKDVVILKDGQFVHSESYIHDSYSGLEMRFSSEVFRQVNREAFTLLLSTVHEMTEGIKWKYAADLYCGSGVFGLMLARDNSDAHVIGIEINADSVRDATENAKLNGIENIEFIANDSSALRDSITEETAPTLVTVDPPRAGLSQKVRDDLILLSPENIVYISCNPQTLARDLCDFTKNGYSIMRIVPVNMFPRCGHVECAVRLFKEKS